MLHAPNTFEPAPNIISKNPKIPFILEMKNLELKIIHSEKIYLEEIFELWI